MKRSPILHFTAFSLLAGAVIGFAAPVAENWENHCTKCHGSDGKGQTKVGRKLALKDYTSAEVQAKMTDEEILQAIADGVFDNGKERMKGYKAELGPGEIKELVAYVRKFKR